MSRFIGLVGWVLLPACYLLEPEEGFRDVYSSYSLDELFVVAEAALDREYLIERADLEAGRIESAWSEALPERGGRLLRRRRALVRLTRLAGDVELGVRVETQIKRTNLDSPGWLPAGDDNVRAARLFREIRMFLTGCRPDEAAP